MNSFKHYPYTYRPGAVDISDPAVIQGVAIKPGARIRRAPEFNPPMYPTKVFAMVQDANGNVMSVYKQAIQKES